MSASQLRMIVVIPLLSVLVESLGWLTSHPLNAAPAAKGAKPGTSKTEIIFPKDPKAIVLSYDPGAGGFVRKGEAPYLKIQADGEVTVTSVFDGTKTEAKLTPEELDELVRFVIEEKDFFNVTEAKIADEIKALSVNGPFIAIGGAGTAVIKVDANDTQHEVSYRGAASYLKTYPKAKVLAQFVAVEKRLSEYGDSVAKGKAAGNAKPKKKGKAK